MIEATLHEHSLTTRDLLRQQVISAKKFPFVAAAPLSASVSPTAWLRVQSEPQKVLWSSRGNTATVCGAGAASTVEADPGMPAASVFDACREILDGNEQLLFYGGFAFRRDQSMATGPWQSFGSAKFWLPRATYDGSVVRVVVLNAKDRDRASEFLDKLRWNVESPASQIPAAKRRQDLPQLEDWERSIDKALDLFQQEVLEKIVLARKASFEFSEALCPISLCERLAAATHACYHFCFQIDGRNAFLGATPECLFKRNGRILSSEVVAGTRRRDTDVREDRRLADELLASTKDQLEHDIVRKSIRQRLHAHVESLQVDSQASILKLAKKQHLFSRVSGKLKPNVNDGCLIERLHPTPAVGGYPTENALAEIDRLEPFDRGWYAGPVGYIGTNDAEFAVAIRSGLVGGRQLSLYSGAGIVPGSTAQLEWEEIEHKIGDFLDIIQHAG